MIAPTLALWALGALAPAPPPAPLAPAAEGDRPADRVVLHRLENGWTFLLLPRHDAPVVSFETYIDVGSVNERPGIAGMAHMFEHMAFKGSDRLGSKDWAAEQPALERVEQAYQELARVRASGEPEALAEAEQAFAAAQAAAADLLAPEAYGKVLEVAGGSRSLNAWTSSDETVYVVSLPANRVELWCWMERERFTRPVLREFYKERDAVMEERRMRVESDPQGMVWEAFMETAFQVHPYRIPTVGTPEDLRTFTRTDAEAFYAANYGARRFVSAIVGDFDPEQVVPLLERYFGDVPPGPEPVKIEAVEPKQTEERRTTVAFPAEPLVMMGWHVPPLAHPDHAALDVAVRLLGHSRSSRLERRLIREDASALAVYVGLGWPGDRHPNVAGVFVVPSGSVPTTEVEAAVYEEIERLAAEGPEAEELEGVVRVARAEVLRGMRSNEALADGLCQYQSKTGDWNNYFRRPERLEAVTAADVQRVLREHFTKENRTVVTLEPQEQER